MVTLRDGPVTLRDGPVTLGLGRLTSGHSCAFAGLCRTLSVFRLGLTVLGVHRLLLGLFLRRSSLC